MRKRIFLNCLIAASFVIGLAFMSGCEGPTGPAGADGADGADGTNGVDGTDGTDGVDGNVTCLECHSATTPDEKATEFARSVHAAGAIAVDYAGSRTSCAQCHSHEGYLEFARTGSVAETIAIPTAWQCKTCHNIHTTFEQTDYAFRLGDPVTFVSGTTVDGLNNNTCLNCHQARRDVTNYDPPYANDTTFTRTFTDPDDILIYNDPAHSAIGPAGTRTLNGTGDTLVVVFDVPTTHAYISSTHAGPHHGPQGNVWAGEIGVTAGVPFDAHADGCVKCHMGPESGHSFKPKSENCTVTDCHSSDKDDALEAFATRVDAVGAALEDLHAVHLDPEEGRYHPQYASLPRADFNAWWDFMVLYEDRSNSAHNPTYAKDLLDGAETQLGL
jgi:hypothetical protein